MLSLSFLFFFFFVLFSIRLLFEIYHKTGSITYVCTHNVYFVIQCVSSNIIFKYHKNLNYEKKKQTYKPTL